MANLAKKPLRKKRRGRIVLYSLLGFFVVLFSSFFIYAGIYYHSSDVASYLENSETVQVEKQGDIAFLPKGATKAGFVFYPGAKVEEKAYAPFLFRLAEKGVASYLIKMPFRFAFLGIDKAKGYPQKNPSIPFYLGGHSLGGSMAASFLHQADQGYRGLALFASYSVDDLTSKGLITTTIFGSEDRVLNAQEYQKNLSHLPLNNREYVIDGGNHSGIAYYGPQDGDGVARISKDEQIAQSINALLAFMGLA